MLSRSMGKIIGGYVKKVFLKGKLRWVRIKHQWEFQRFSSLKILCRSLFSYRMFICRYLRQSSALVPPYQGCPNSTLDSHYVCLVWVCFCGSFKLKRAIIYAHVYLTLNHVFFLTLQYSPTPLSTSTSSCFKKKVLPSIAREETQYPYWCTEKRPQMIPPPCLLEIAQEASRLR